MIQRYRGPSRYRQGEGALESAGDALAELDATNALVIGGETALSTAEDGLRRALDEADLTVRDTVRGVERCSRETVADCVDRSDGDGTVVVGVGGGHALDTAKMTSIELDAPLTIVPTVASTDAPCSAIAAVYDDETGAYEGVVHRDRNPELVVVDTRLLAEAPTRFLRYGMADALATTFEAEAVARNPAAETVAGGRPSDTGLTLARRCYENLRAHGTDALAAAERDAVTPSFETVVETNTLLSGIGFECGGLAAAHAYQEGFTRAGVDVPHGIAVGVGLLAQLVLEGREETLEEVLSLSIDLGIDATLEEVNVDEETAEEIAAHACAEDTPMGNEPVTVTADRARDALFVADELVRERRNQ